VPVVQLPDDTVSTGLLPCVTESTGGAVLTGSAVADEAVKSAVAIVTRAIPARPDMPTSH